MILEATQADLYQVVKDPDATLDYGFNFENWLNDGDTISASSWAAYIVDGEGTVLTVVSDSFTDTTTKTTVEAGDLGQRYMLTNSIETAEGLKDDRSINIVILER